MDKHEELKVMEKFKADCKDALLIDFLQKIAKIHTTKMGEERIRRNLSFDRDKVSDIILWCTNAILNAELIAKKGKNWYIYKDDTKITVNTNSFTVITAHKLKENKTEKGKQND